jgi:RNA polymerase sigma-70 factor (ECF subfamily)
VDERELLARLRRGDEDAFDAIFRAHYPPLVGVAEGMLRSRAVAEEVVQDVMLELWRRREGLPVEESLRAYLFRATRNRALNSLRHSRVERRGEPHAAGPTAEPARAPATLVEEEIDTALREAVGSLPERCRDVFELSRVHGLRYAEIASTLGISVKTVEAQMGKALRILRERLAAWLPGGGAAARGE